MSTNTQNGLMSQFEIDRDRQCERDEEFHPPLNFGQPKRRYAVEGFIGPIPGRNFIGFNFTDPQFAIVWPLLTEFVQQGRVDAEGALANICEALLAAREQRQSVSIESFNGRSP